MSEDKTTSTCGQPPCHWYETPWVNILGNGASVKDLRITRRGKEERDVLLVADLEFDFKEGIEWMIVVVGLDATNSSLHMQSKTGTINAVVRTQPGEVVDLEFLFRDNSTRLPRIEPEGRVLAVLVRDWEAEQCGLLIPVGAAVG